jgi:hypothetical protein
MRKVEYNNVIYSINSITAFLAGVYFPYKGRRPYMEWEKEFLELIKDYSKKERMHTFLRDDWFDWRGRKDLPTIRIYREEF